MPKRWIAFDTESRTSRTGEVETQTWRTGAAIRWRTDLKTGDHAEAQTFDSAESLWQWVTDYCRKGFRTVTVCHNLGHDIRISDAMRVLPTLGWCLEWCNLDRNVSSMTWRSDHGTLVFMDTWTWLPMELSKVAETVGLIKYGMPHVNALPVKWEQYCMRDAEIVYRTVTDLISYITVNELGNWQPTGAGMSYATWRHKFMHHKILVHDDENAIAAERAAMHAGRAEAWKHGVLDYGVWTEVDMRNAYTTIAAECELPLKLHMQTGAMTNEQFRKLRATYCVLGYCSVDTACPVVPYHTGQRTIWPTGTFKTWLWDIEIEALIKAGSKVSIHKGYVYTRGFVLQEWGQWVLSILRTDDRGVSPVVKTWLKHCSRALIGRIALRCPSWELFGANPDNITGITHDIDVSSGRERRMMHVGDRTFCETARTEGRDSLPQVTGRIMAICRVRLWDAMCAAGLSEVAHVDTDALLVSAAGLSKLRAAWGASFAEVWSVKGSSRRLIIYGPRNYRQGQARKSAGVPRKAREILPNVFEGERWRSVSTDMESGRSDIVTVETGRWHVKSTDPRRLDSPEAGTSTVPIQLAAGSPSTVSSSSSNGTGA